MGAGRSEAQVIEVQVRRQSMSSSRSSSGYQSEAADDIDGGLASSWPTPPLHLPDHITANAPSDATVTATDSSLLIVQRRLEIVRKLCRLLAADIIDYMLKKSSSSSCPRCQHAATMRRVVDELSSRHHIIFASIVKKLSLQMATDAVSSSNSAADRWRSTFVSVADGLFADGRYNWGRVVTVYAFAGWLVRQQSAIDSSSGGSGKADELARIITDVAGEWVADRLSTWICQQGGWDTFDAFFPEQQTFESTLWQGLLFTLIGLGVLVLITLSR